MCKKIIIYFIFVLLFAVGKFGFILYHDDVFAQYTIGQWFDAIWHGLPHDLTSAGYLMALPAVVQLVYIWYSRGQWHGTFMRFWLRLSILLVLINYFSDLVLYGYWGFRLDSTALFYLLDNPVEALGQAEWWMLVLAPIVIFAFWYMLQKMLCMFYPKAGSHFEKPVSAGRRSLQTVAALMLCGVCFVAIRGGVTTSTMNVGRVYFSTEMPLNHAATNPFFSFFNSLSKKQKDFKKQYRFMDAAEAERLYSQMNTGEVTSASMDTLLNVSRPNIVLIIFESFSGAACTGVCEDADPTIMPNVNRMYSEGIGFTNLFANSFRTDRGCASILASYPAQPTYSVMKDQDRCNNLQYLGKRLKENGYDLHFIHGGDVNFTNMRGFLTTGGFEHITGDTDFPITDRLSKWGVPDGPMFSYLYDEIACEESADSPFLKVMLTLSSHEPFDVDYHHFDNPYVNSVAYADSCFGSFIDRIRQTPAWDNLLIIGVADHAFARYPEGIQNHETLRYRIPMFWAGGAVTTPKTISTYGSQTDLAATLLAQMGIDHTDFNFSKNLCDSTIGHYAFYTFSDGFGLVNDTACYVQDNSQNGNALSGSSDPTGIAESYGKAYLQTLYDDLAGRKGCSEITVKGE
ncbi:MAG: sulfatase-like hydrolase/transferase [Bacteroidales bacterium]|nr:sulfatase-like hydrolase/transferase [Candidatus Liminaster caballi]